MDYGCRTLRKDALISHEKTAQHRDAITAELHFDSIAEKMTTEAQAVTEDAIKVIQHNLPLDLFGDLVELAVGLGAARIKKLIAGNKKHPTLVPIQCQVCCNVSKSR